MSADPDPTPPDDAAPGGVAVSMDTEHDHSERITVPWQIPDRGAAHPSSSGLVASLIFGLGGEGAGSHRDGGMPDADGGMPEYGGAGQVFIRPLEEWLAHDAETYPVQPEHSLAAAVMMRAMLGAAGGILSNHLSPQLMQAMMGQQRMEDVRAYEYDPDFCEAIVASLPVVAADDGRLATDDGGPPTCVVCMDGLLSETAEKNERGDAVMLPCDHAFHRTCIGGWLRERLTCPSCRASLSGT